jgi:hypothetical protein
VLALKLANAKDFEHTAQAFVSSRTGTAEKEIYEAMFFEDSRIDVIRSLTPTAFLPEGTEESL